MIRACIITALTVSLCFTSALSFALYTGKLSPYQQLVTSDQAAIVASLLDKE